MMTKETSTPNHWLQWLIEHTWRNIFKESWTKWRLSRGEYFMCVGMIGLLSWIITIILSQIGTIGMWLGMLVSLISSLRSLGFIIKRSHDLNKNWWYYFRPTIILILTGILYIISLYLKLPQSIGSTITYVFWAAALASLIRMIVIAFKIVFTKWTLGANQYWEDRLPSQPVNNWIYWLLWISMFVVSILLSVYNPVQQSQNSAIEQMFEQRFWSMWIMNMK